MLRVAGRVMTITGAAWLALAPLISQAQPSPAQALACLEVLACLGVIAAVARPGRRADAAVRSRRTAALILRAAKSLTAVSAAAWTAAIAVCDRGHVGGWYALAAVTLVAGTAVTRGLARARRRAGSRPGPAAAPGPEPGACSETPDGPLPPGEEVAQDEPAGRKAS